MTDANDEAATESGKPRVRLETQVYKGILMAKNEIEEIQKMEIRADDIWVCSYPRSGTTLMQEMSFLVETLDFKKARTVELDERFPIIEVKDDRYPYYKGLKYVEQLSSPRMIKSHLHHFLLPEQLRMGKGKVIYIARNPKDIVTSLFRQLQWTDEFTEEFTQDTYLDLFVQGKAVYCPWPRHVLEYWERRDSGHMLFLKFEDVVKDMPSAVRKVADFLGKTLTEDQVSAICQHCHVDNMRANDKVNMSYYRTFKHVNDTNGGGFINKGKPGTWKEVLTATQAARIDEMIKQLDGSGLSFDQE